MEETTRTITMIRIFVFSLLTVPATMAQATFHGDAARTGVYDAAGPVQLKGTKWTFKTEGPIIGSPAIANGVVYIGSIDGNLYAVDQETGKQKWKFKTLASRQVTSSPTIANVTLARIGFAFDVRRGSASRKS
jgi:hypothetical protein